MGESTGGREAPMANDFKVKLVTKLVRWWLGMRQDNKIVHVNQVLQRAEGFLVCLPKGCGEEAFWADILARIKQRFPDCRITVVVEQVQEDLVKLNRWVDKTIVFSDNDRNLLSLPAKGLIEVIRARRFDVALDLNDNFDLMTAYLCWRSGADLRVGFYTEDGYPFFNLGFVPKKGGGSTRESLAKLIDLLASFRR